MTKPRFSLKAFMLVVTLIAVLLGLSAALTSGPAPTTMIYYPFGVPTSAEPDTSN